jgi:hypothetical protein
MIKRGSGVILMHTPEPAALGVPHMDGMSPAWAAMEALSRDLSAELPSPLAETTSRASEENFCATCCES